MTREPYQLDALDRIRVVDVGVSQPLGEGKSSMFSGDVPSGPETVGPLL
jgi:hypothetical protein